MSQALINSNETITITKQDIFHQIQLSCKVPELVEQILTRKIIVSAALKADIKVTKEELQIASDRMRAVSQLNDARTTWTWLEKHALSLDDFEEIIHTTLISSKLTNHLFAEQVEPYFYEHQLDYAGAIIYEIVLDDRDEALELFYEIQEGEISFQEAARQYIQDPELRRRGGYRGQVNRADLKPEVSTAVFAAKPSQLLKPIITADGVYLILVEEIVKPKLNSKIRQQIAFDLFCQWINKQMNQVKYNYSFEQQGKSISNPIDKKIVEQ